MKSSVPVSVSPFSGEPMVEQLHRQFRWLLASGSWKAGDRLPSIRTLARQLGINMHTIRSAYQRLENDGLVHTRQGAGTHVLEFNPRALRDKVGRGRSYTIGVILPNMSQPFYHDFLQGVEQGMDQEKSLLFVCDAHEDEQQFLRYFSQLTARDVDGIIVASYDLTSLLGEEPFTGLPFVTVDSPRCTAPVVNLDLEGAAFQSVNHLVEHGYQRIGLITFSDDGGNVGYMNAGYFRALKDGGIPADERLIVRVNGFRMEDGITGARALMTLENPPRAIFTIADTMALGVLKMVRNAGWSVPGEVALASLDDISIAGLVEPGLTTVSLPARQLGLEAMNMLQDLINGGRWDGQAITLPSRLVVRQSCGCE